MRHAIVAIVTAVLSVAFASTALAGFEWSGFRSGMTVEQAKASLSKMGFEHIQQDATDKGVALIARDVPPQDGRLIVLNFCQGRLYVVDFDIQPSPMNFIKTFDQYRQAFGQPFDTVPGSSITSIGETGMVAVFWKQPYGWFSVQYHVFPTNDQLTLRLEDTSLCP